MDSRNPMESWLPAACTLLLIAAHSQLLARNRSLPPAAVVRDPSQRADDQGVYLPYDLDIYLPQVVISLYILHVYVMIMGK